MQDEEPRLTLWQAVLTVLLGAAGAQLAGAIAQEVMRATLGPIAHGGNALQIRPATLAVAMIVTELTLIGAALLAPLSIGATVRRALGLRPAPPLVFLAAALGTVLLGPLADLMMRAMERLLPDMNLGVVAMLHQIIKQLSPLLAWPVFALLPGIAEELMFRGLLQNAARSRNVGIAVSALGFAAFHLDPHHIAGVLPLGFFLAWVGARCGTLVTIVAHIANNTLAIIAVHSETLDVGYGTSEPMPWSWLPVSLVLAALAARVIAKNCPVLPDSPSNEAYSEPHGF
jgi:membrane protease YdiL (CAAX protease family)